jgi:HlyD family secretion protein
MSVLLGQNEGVSHYSYANRYRTGRESRIIYGIAVLAVIVTFCVLPFIAIQISIKSHGVLQSAMERTELFTSVSGRIIKIMMKDNQALLRGDTLLIVDSSLPGQQSKLLNSRSELLRNLLHDVVQIVQYAERSDIRDTDPVLKTEQYKAAWRQFLQESEERLIVRRQAERVLSRYDALFKNGVLTASEYEKFRFDYDQASSSHSLLGRRYKSQWETEAGSYRKELSDLIGREAELDEQKKLFTLRAPVNGSLQNLSGLQAGSYVFANQKIAEISPDAQLIAFCYVKPSDIGLIRKGQSVNFQIDAFNYNQWGLLSGKVLDISDDIIFMNTGEAVFKVRCSLDNDHLKLKNEYKGYLKKGMNFTARFMVARRSLFQLLYDDADNWLNPNLRVNELSGTKREL